MTVSMIVSSIISIVSIALSYLCGRLQSMAEGKQNAFREAYETLYLPFIALLYETQIWNTGFANMVHSNQDRISSLLTDNIRYMNPSSLEWMDIFLTHRVSSTKTIGILTPERLDEVFDCLTIALLEQASWLSHKLHQPHLGTHVRNLYQENQTQKLPT